jgi:hypothetical protein
VLVIEQLVRISRILITSLEDLTSLGRGREREGGEGKREREISDY